MRNLAVCVVLVTQAVALSPEAQSDAMDSLAARFQFDSTFENHADGSIVGEPGSEGSFIRGLKDKALRIGSGDLPAMQIPSASLKLGPESSFSLQFWVRKVAASDKRFVLVSQRAYPDNSLESQKRSGWSFYCSHGTWAWSMGSKGRRRVTYERDNGARMPLNDGRWHQLTMTYAMETSTVRLYYDGINKATYNVQDSSGFDFGNSDPLTVGWQAESQKSEEAMLPAIAATAGAC